MYFSELELATIYGSGQKTGKQNLQVVGPEPCISASSSLQKYTVRVKKPEHKIVKFLTRAVYFGVFDPGRVLFFLPPGVEGRSTRTYSEVAVNPRTEQKHRF
jgi:hypothetical protein